MYLPPEGRTEGRPHLVLAKHNVAWDKYGRESVLTTNNHVYECPLCNVIERAFWFRYGLDPKEPYPVCCKWCNPADYGEGIALFRSDGGLHLFWNDMRATIELPLGEPCAMLYLRKIPAPLFWRLAVFNSPDTGVSDVYKKGFDETPRQPAQEATRQILANVPHDDIVEVARTPGFAGWAAYLFGG